MTCLYRQSFMKFLKVITALSLPMGKQEQERHIPWKEELGKRFDFARNVVVICNVSLMFFLLNCFQLYLFTSVERGISK